MSLENFKIFRDIAQTKRISRGAAMNGISQSAASQLIQQLERKLGVALFDRSKRPLALTPAGQVYYEGCKDLLRRYDQVETDAPGPRARAHYPELSLAVEHRRTDDLEGAIIPDWLKEALAPTPA